jgi:glycosyltransferase involved in cell wall biosynthesis
MLVCNAKSDYSVILPVYKNDKPEFFRRAIDSILNQTIKSNDIIIICDGRIPSELDKLVTNYGKEPNVNVIRIEQPLGLWNAINVGIKNSKNELIARMDSDDISVSNRAALQLAAFDDDAALSIVGGQIAEFENSPDNVIAYRKVSTNHDDIVRFSKRRSPFNHPTVMYKKSCLLQLAGYNRLSKTEDYDLWLRMLSEGYKAKNLDQVLLYYRVNNAAISRRKSWAKTRELIKLRIKYYRVGYIKCGDMLIANAVNLFLFIMPNKVSYLFYRRFLRQ